MTTQAVVKDNQGILATCEFLDYGNETDAAVDATNALSEWFLESDEAASVYDGVYCEEMGEECEQLANDIKSGMFDLDDPGEIADISGFSIFIE